MYMARIDQKDPQRAHIQPREKAQQVSRYLRQRHKRYEDTWAPIRIMKVRAVVRRVCRMTILDPLPMFSERLTSATIKVRKAPMPEASTGVITPPYMPPIDHQHNER